ncbi:dentin sialophosphoprotein-like [Dendroctonus ponderosae]|uniref:dentin sialophosphoprotein-like n=1 Tax=Dendroctonus ponderosae TaxID=77166 RepID=UPI00203570A7|nr:dentin sialophosphoprotein-like [Dendroctonus ponderosae]
MGQVRKNLTLLVLIIGFSVVISAPAKKSKCDGKGLNITPSEQSCLLGHMLEVLTQLINNQKHPICLKTKVPQCFHDSGTDQNKTDVHIRDDTSDRSYNEDSASETCTNEDTSEACDSAELYSSSTESQPTSKAYEYPEEEYEDISKDIPTTTSVNEDESDNLNEDISTDRPVTTAATEVETETTETEFSDVSPTTAASDDVKENIYGDISTDVPVTTPATNDDENTEENLNEDNPTTTAANEDESENLNEDNSSDMPLTTPATEYDSEYTKKDFDDSIPITTEAREDTNEKGFPADFKIITRPTPEPTIDSLDADASFATTTTEITDLNSITRKD